MDKIIKHFTLGALAGFLLALMGFPMPVAFFVFVFVTIGVFLFDS